jgi:hypothetical protein
MPKAAPTAMLPAMVDVHPFGMALPTPTIPKPIKPPTSVDITICLVFPPALKEPNPADNAAEETTTIIFTAIGMASPAVAILAAIPSTATVLSTTTPSFRVNQFTKFRPSGSTFEIGSPPQKSYGLATCPGKRIIIKPEFLKVWYRFVIMAKKFCLQFKKIKKGKIASPKCSRIFFTNFFK